MDDTVKADQLDIKVRVSSLCHEVQSEYLQPDTGMVCDSALGLWSQPRAREVSRPTSQEPSCSDG